MNFSHSTGENRLLSLTLAEANARLVNKPAPIPQVYTQKTAPLPASYGGGQVSYTGNVLPGQSTPLPSQKVYTNPNTSGLPMGNYGVTGVAPGYNINNDPTYIGNLGPAPGESYSGGTVRSDGTMAGGSNTSPYLTLQQRMDAAASNAENEAKFGSGVSAEEKQRVRAMAVQNELLKVQAEQTAQQSYSQQQQRSAASTAAGNTGNSLVASRLHTRLGAITGDRQTYIEKRRAEGASDIMIRDELAKGAVAPTPQSNGTPPTGWDQTTYDNFKKANPTLEPTPEDTARMQGADNTGSTSSTNAPGSTGTSGTGNKPAPIPYTPQQQTILNTMQGIMNDPAQDPITKIIAQQYISEIQTGKENLDMIAQGASTQADVFEKMRADITDTTDKVAGNLNKSYAMVNDAAKSIREERDKSINAAQQAQQQRLQWDADNQTRKISDAKRVAHDEAVASLAVTGRMGSSGAISILNGVNKQYDQQLQDLQNEVGVQKTELSAKFTGLHSQVSEDYFTAVSGNIKDFTASLNNLQMQGLSGRQSIDTAENSALQTFVTNTVNARQAMSKSLMDGIKEMQTIANTARDDERAQTKENKDNAYQMFNFAYTNSTDPALRKAAAEQMRAAGYDLPMNIDYANLTPDQQIKMLDLAAKQKEAASTLSPADYTGEAKNVAMMAANVQLNLTDSDKKVFNANQAPMIASLLQQGKTEEAKKIIYDAAVTNLSQSRKDVADRRAMVSYLDYAIGRLESAKDLPGFYTGKWNDAKKYFGAQQNAEYRDIASVVSLASVESLHELYGSALTENEMETARTILPLKGSNMLDAIQQLKNFRAYQNNKQEQIVQGISGGGAFGPGSNSSTVKKPMTNEGMQNSMDGNNDVPKLKEPEVVTILKKAGFTGKGLQIAMAVSRGESVGWNPNAVGDKAIQNDKWGPSVGLFQIRTLKDGSNKWRDASKLNDPLYNAQAAYEISKGGTDWGPWSVYTSGSYKEHMKKLSEDYSSTV